MSQQHPRIRSSGRIVLAVLLSVSLLGSIVAPAAVTAQAANGSATVTEAAYEQPAPDPGDEYFEAAAEDGSWVSYVNPRDEYRDPYLGDGSGKICTLLLNEAGEPIVGETVPNTTVTIPTGETLEWHTGADPMTVDYPLDDNYERPLDADQFGTADDLAQGDGYMDSHCIEFHGPAIGDTIEYGEATVDGTHADRIELIGYIQKTSTWESDIDDRSGHLVRSGWRWMDLPRGRIPWTGRRRVATRIGRSGRKRDRNRRRQRNGNEQRYGYE